MGEAEPSPRSQLSAWVPSGYRPWLSCLAQVGALLSSTIWGTLLQAHPRFGVLGWDGFGPHRTAVPSHPTACS